MSGAPSYDREPIAIAFAETSAYKDTYAGAEDFVFFDGQHLRPHQATSKSIIVFSHPIGGGSYLPLVTALAAAGQPVLYANLRYRGNDTALVMEKCAVDLGAAVRYAKETLGYEKVLLGGWSGGGSLSLFYQAEAEDPRVTQTPAGDPPDLTQADLIPADGILLLAAHISRAGTLCEWIDASVLDEAKPFERDPQLNLYHAENPNQPPYCQDFLKKYRAAQRARMDRIDTWVAQRLLQLEHEDRVDEAFVVQGTMSDPRWLDPAVDPNQRQPNHCYLGDPRVVNDSPVGLARFTTLRSWLSQWSLAHSNADGIACAARTTVPTLVIGNLADDACTPSHTHRLYQAIPHDGKELHEIDGATHYYIGQKQQLQEAVDLVQNWIANRSW